MKQNFRILQNVIVQIISPVCDIIVMLIGNKMKMIKNDSEIEFLRIKDDDPEGAGV